MSGPLQGVRVIELPAIGPVPFLGMLLADLGAEVVRIDRLPGGPAGIGDVVNAGAISRGRRSVALDLRQPAAAEVVGRLAEHSDALIEGFRPGVTERLGIGPDALLARNPALVYGRMTGWGQHGPLAATAGHDLTYLAITGLLHGIGPAERPIPPINYVADFGGGSMFLATGLLAALLHARATGEGQVVDAAMTDGAAYLGSLTRTLRAAGRWRDEREVNMLDGGVPNYRCYRCADGSFVAVGALEPKFWQTLLDTLGAEVHSVPSPYDPAQFSACRDWLTDVFASQDRDHWAQLFAATDACVAPVLTLDEALGHPHNVARQTFLEVAGASVPAPAPRFSRTQGVVGQVPAVGADTSAVLEELRYSAEQRDKLAAEGIIG